MPLAVALALYPAWALDDSMPGKVGRLLMASALFGLLAAAYACLASRYLALRILYPRQWNGEAHIRESAQNELARHDQRSVALRALMPILPALIVGLLLADSQFPARELGMGRSWLLPALGGLGTLAGLAFAIGVSVRLASLSFAFTRGGDDAA
jgi:hypothetical protein